MTWILRFDVFHCTPYTFKRLNFPYKIRVNRTSWQVWSDSECVSKRWLTWKGVVTEMIRIWYLDGFLVSCDRKLNDPSVKWQFIRYIYFAPDPVLLFQNFHIFSWSTYSIKYAYRIKERIFLLLFSKSAQSRVYTSVTLFCQSLDRGMRSTESPQN